MKLKKVENKSVNYPSGEKYYNFAHFFGSVAVGAAMVVSGCSNKKEKSEKENTIKKPVKCEQGNTNVNPENQNGKKKPVIHPGKIKHPDPKIHKKGDIAPVQPMKPIKKPGELKAPKKPEVIRKKGLVAPVSPKKNPDKKVEKEVFMGRVPMPKPMTKPDMKKKPKRPNYRGRMKIAEPLK